jgi:hypothetical protein
MNMHRLFKTGVHFSFRTAAILLACTAALSAQTFRLSNPSSSNGAELGYSQALDGALIALGSPGESLQTGAVYVRSCAIGNCSAAQRLAAVDLLAGDQFGSSVALSGNTLAIAASGQNPGAVYVYVFNAGQWALQARLVAPDGALSAGFGSALALQGERLLIGAGRADNRRGAAYVYARSGNIWLQRQRLAAAAAQAGDSFGYAVALDGDTALIGAPGRAGLTPGSFSLGAVYAFVDELGIWSQQALLLAAAGANGDRLGSAVSLDGDLALLGAPLAANAAGSAYLFQRSAGQWSELAQLGAVGVLPGDRFGWSLALAGDLAVVGAPYTEASCGAGYLFRPLVGNWVEVPGATVGDRAFGHLLGWSVANDGQRWLLGAPGFGGAAEHRGAAYWFDPIEQVLGTGFEGQAATACVDPAP